MGRQADLSHVKFSFALLHKRGETAAALSFAGSGLPVSNWYEKSRQIAQDMTGTPPIFIRCTAYHHRSYNRSGEQSPARSSTCHFVFCPGVRLLIIHHLQLSGQEAHIGWPKESHMWRVGARLTLGTHAYFALYTAWVARTPSTCKNSHL